MIFWTFVLLFFYGYSLIKGNFFGNRVAEMGKIAMELKEVEDDEGVLADRNKKELAKRMLVLAGMTFVPALIILAIEIIYYCSAISVDPYKYPSIAMLFFLVLNFAWVRSQSKNTDLKTEEGRQNFQEAIVKVSKRYTLRGMTIAGFKFLYFAYMFWVLSFRIVV